MKPYASTALMIAGAFVALSLAACGMMTHDALSSTSTTAAMDAQAAAEACADQIEGAACTFTSHDGQELTGTCQAGCMGDGELRCKPDGMPGEMDGMGHHCGMDGMSDTDGQSDHCGMDGQSDQGMGGMGHGGMGGHQCQGGGQGGCGGM